MAEAAIGLAASAITLAALFSSCVECFSYFKAAQNCPVEAESLLVKLDCEKARLLVWGNTVGILQTDARDRYSQLADLKQDDLIRRCINQIISLLTDARTLQAEYGGRQTNQEESQRYLAVLSVNSMNIFQATKRTFFARTGAKHATPNLLSRIKWAIRDAAKFRLLLLNLRDFVDSLIQLVPVPPETINRIVEEDIVSTIDLTSLKLIADGCDEENYPQWSARATETIRESVTGTIDRRNLAEVLRDIGGIDRVEQESATSKKSQTSNFSAHYLQNSFLVLTDSCLNFESGKSHDCGLARIGDAVAGFSSQVQRTAFCSPESTTWNLGRRILSSIQLTRDAKIQLRDQEAIRLETMKLNTEMTNVQPVCRVYVYCGLCACAISTANTLVEGDNIPEHFEFFVRIDDRIPTSCRGFESAGQCLEAIQDAHDLYEASSSYLSRSHRAFDSPALDQRMFALEQEDYTQNETDNMLHRVLPDKNKFVNNDDGISIVIIISEADFGTKSLEQDPFLQVPRKPRAGEIYELDSIWQGGKFEGRRRYIGRYTKSKLAMDLDRAREAASQALLSPGSSSVASVDPTAAPRKRPRLESDDD